jgi:hypothetical protein
MFNDYYVVLKRERNGGLPQVVEDIVSSSWKHEAARKCGHDVANRVEDSVGVGFADFMIKETFDPATN